jgi:hypothetical protein
MPIYNNATALPRTELASALVRTSTANRDVDFIANDVFPITSSDNLSAWYPVVEELDSIINASVAVASAPGVDIERIPVRIGATTQQIAVYKTEADVADEIMLNWQQYLGIEALSASIIRRRLMITREVLAATALFNATTFPPTNSATAYTAANLATMTPITDIQAAQARVLAKGERPNAVVMSEAVFNRISLAAQTVAFVAGSVNPSAMVNQKTLELALEATLGIRHVYVGRAIQTTSATGATEATYGSIWNNTYIWVGCVREGEANTLGVPSFDGAAANFVFSPIGEMSFESYRDTPRAANVIRGQSAILPAIVNSGAGTMIATQYS